MTETETNVDIALQLATSYCRLHDAHRAVERAKDDFERRLLDATAGEVEYARQDLAMGLAATFSVEVREVLARRVAAGAPVVQLRERAHFYGNGT